MMKAMDAFHANWTRPFFAFNGRTEYMPEDFEILVTMLSALMWRRTNGGIRMVTDKAGAQCYQKLGMEPLWDLGVSDALEGMQAEGIDPFLFWAAGKLFALRMQQTPCVMLDTDFIVWTPLSQFVAQLPLAAIHREALYPDVYPDKDFFDMDEGYAFDEAFDWKALACNTALCYFGDEGLKDAYISEAVRFMKHLRACPDRVASMVFAEQRLLAMCAKRRGVPIASIMDLAHADPRNQRLFTHVWGYKDDIREREECRRAFCVRCVCRILRDFPRYEGMLKGIGALRPYYEEGKRCVRQGMRAPDLIFF